MRRRQRYEPHRGGGLDAKIRLLMVTHVRGMKITRILTFSGRLSI
eukprot:COSAG03_NODE_6892_length_990_cov_0.693603_1_plen_44_part_10